MRFRLLSAVLAALILGAGAAHAQSSPPPPSTPAALSALTAEHPVTEQSLAAARRLMLATGVREALETSIPPMISGLITPMARARQMSDADTQTIIQVLTEEIRREFPSLIEMSARAYARRFTVDEMNRVSEFFESGTGRRFVAQQPAMMTEMMQVGQAWGQQVVAPRAVARIEEALRRKRGEASP